MVYTWASARRFRCVFLALISLSVLSVLVVSSRMGVASRPQWAYVFWTDNLQLFEHLYPQYLHVAKAVKKVSLADMARYALLHQVGGLYVDSDFQCLQPFDDLHRENELFLSSEPLVHTIQLEKANTAALCNTLMASAPGHPFWLRVLDNIKDTFNRERLKSDAVELTGLHAYLSPNTTFNRTLPFLRFPRNKTHATHRWQCT